MYQTGTTPAKAGTKNDSGKLRWDLVDYKSMESMVASLTFGVAKYEENNWQKVDNPKDRYFAAIMRHIVAWRNGEKVDEDGQSHLGAVMANAMFLDYFDRQEGK